MRSEGPPAGEGSGGAGELSADAVAVRGTGSRGTRAHVIWDAV